MKKFLLFAATALFLISCGGEAEEATDETTDDTDSMEVAEEIVVPPTPTELALGNWVSDPDARALAWEEEQDVVLTDDEKAQMAEMFSGMFLDLNENQTYEMGGMIREEMNGTGLWEMDDAGTSLTLTPDEGDVMDCVLGLQSEDLLQFQYVKTDGGSTQTTNFEYKRK